MTYKLADYKNNITTSKVSYGLISKFYLDVITITIFSTVDSIHDFSKKESPSHDHQISLFLSFGSRGVCCGSFPPISILNWRRQSAKSG